MTPRERTVVLFALVAAAVAWVVLVSGAPRARAADTVSPAAAVVDSTLAAATATRLSASVQNRQAAAVQNNDTVAIWCGFGSGVTNTNDSWQVPPNGGTWSVPYSWLRTGTGDVWCYSVAGTAASAVRFMEAR